MFPCVLKEAAGYKHCSNTHQDAAKGTKQQVLHAVSKHPCHVSYVCRSCGGSHESVSSQHRHGVAVSTGPQVAFLCRLHLLTVFAPPPYASPLVLLLPQDLAAVVPYLKGYLLRDAGLEALIRSMMMPSPLLREVAVKGWALGEALLLLLLLLLGYCCRCCCCCCCFVHGADSPSWQSIPA